jgi:hypothetical protein
MIVAPSNSQSTSTFSNKWNKASLMIIWAPEVHLQILKVKTEIYLGHHIVLVIAKLESCSCNSLDSLGKNRYG